jgi:hypothetical protein
MQYAHEATGTVARWHGGAYIELGYIDESCEFVAGDVINVWDYATDKPRIPRTLDALKLKVDARLTDSDD